MLMGLSTNEKNRNKRAELYFEHDMHILFQNSDSFLGHQQVFLNTFELAVGSYKSVALVKWQSST